MSDVEVFRSHIQFCRSAAAGDELQGQALGAGMKLGLRLALDHPRYALQFLLLLERLTDDPGAAMTTAEVAVEHIRTVPLESLN